MGFRSTRYIGVLLAVCLVTVGAASGFGAAAREDGPAAREDLQLERDSVLMDVHVFENGTAEWRIEYRTLLDDESTTSAFNDLKSDIESDPESYSESFFEGIRGTIAAAENSTGREMEGTNFSVDAEVRQLPQEYGVITYSFRWHGFAGTADDRLRVGDALSGFFLGENERLMISWPDGYELASARPTPDISRHTSAIWTGPADFGQDEPRMTFAPVASDTGSPGPIWYVAAGALIALALVGAGAYWLTRRRDEKREPVDSPGAPVGEPTNAPDGGLSLDLLSNEERVLRALEKRGGRAKQQEIVDALGWTEAKTSQVISSLREEGKIESFRLGRENVVSMSNADRDA